MAADARTAYLEKLSELSVGTFWDYLGCEIEECRERKVVVSLAIKPHHLNLIGILHGGVYAAMIDSAMGLTAMLERPEAGIVTTNLNLHYVAPIAQGRILVTAKLLHSSGKTITAEARASKDNGDLCAIGVGTFRVMH